MAVDKKHREEQDLERYGVWVKAGPDEINDNDSGWVIEVPKNYQLKPVFYYASVVDLMIENGSLFLWHLKLEGKVLYGKGHFDKIIKNLKPFRCHHEEIMYHAMLFDDLIQSKEYIHQQEKYSY